MLRYVYALTVGITMFYGKALADDLSSKQFELHEVFGEPTNAIQPVIEIQKNGMNWDIEIDYSTEISFPRYTWLKPSQRIGSKLRLWTNNGTEILATNSNVLETSNLPSQTTVLDVMKNIRPPSRRGFLWLQIEPKMRFTGTGFNLQDAFGISFTNDYVLQITPLLYRIETNESTAHLVEFPPIKIRLSADGKAEKVKKK